MSEAKLKKVEVEVLEPEPIYFTCEHETKYQTCHRCNETFCKRCFERHECYE